MRAHSVTAELAVDDATLAMSAAQGDELAFRALYLRHRHGVLTFVTKLVGSGPDRDDVLQDVFLQLHRALPSFRGDASLATFLRRITMNVTFDHVRKQTRRQRIAYDSDALDAAMAAGQDPEQHSSTRQQLQSLLHHLDGIAVDKRRALLLVAIAGFSLHDAAVQMGAHPDWVKQRVVRARRELSERASHHRAARRPRRVEAH